MAGVLLSAVLVAPAARGHATGESYVWLNVREATLDGRFELRLGDLRETLGLDLPTDYEAARPRVAATAPRVHEYIARSFAIAMDGTELPLKFTETGLLQSEGFGHFAQYHYRVAIPRVPRTLDIRNELFFESDRLHRNILAMEHNERTGEDYGPAFGTLVFSSSNSRQVLDLDDVHALPTVRDFCWQGVLHVWIGIDHVLFLIVLLVPTVLRREEDKWLPIQGPRAALWSTLKIVTTFTVAHSITLGLAALDVVRVPSRLIESVIALSIVLVAINNVRPIIRHGTLPIIFFFGLFHGLGFATALAHLPFRMTDLVGVLVAFNVGVELGQVAIVLAVFPIIYYLRTSKRYPVAVLGLGSVATGLLAAFWFVERAFGGAS